MSEAPAAVAQRTDATLAEVAEEIRAADRFLLTTHEGPDGDALGSLLAMHKLLQQLGKDSVMFLAAKEFPLPVEYRFLPLEEVFHEPPVDLVDRLVVFLDCGNIDRMPVDFLRRDDARILNIDHHHDNTRFGTVNLVDTRRLVHRRDPLPRSRGSSGAEITPDIATALYVALVTDTGRFMYENTGPDCPPHGGGADRGRGRRPRHLPTPVRARPDREAPPHCAGDRAHPAARRVPPRRHLHLRRGLRWRRARTNRSPRASSITCGRSRAPRWPRWSATRRDGGACRAQGEPALDDGHRRRLRDRSQPRGRRPSACRRLLDRPVVRRAREVLCTEVKAELGSS